MSVQASRWIRAVLRRKTQTVDNTVLTSRCYIPHHFSRHFPLFNSQDLSCSSHIPTIAPRPSVLHVSFKESVFDLSLLPCIYEGLLVPSPLSQYNLFIPTTIEPPEERSRASNLFDQPLQIGGGHEEDMKIQRININYIFIPPSRRLARQCLFGINSMVISSCSSL